MSNEPQRDIEKDLLAYKQRRREQAGAPLELHPATRKMLQSEAARTAARPLLTSEEAAKNFVRSFVMSHQQPGFFARHKQRVIWGGSLFACLAIVLAVLRNDPQQTAQRSAFPDALPAPPATPAPQPAKPQSAVAANKPQPEAERLARARLIASVDGVQELSKLSAAPAGGPTTANPRGIAAPSAPMPTAQRELDRRSGVASAPLPAVSAPAAANAPAPTGGRAYAKAESALTRAPATDADKKLAEKPASGDVMKLARALKDTQNLGVVLEPEAKKSVEEVKLKVSDELRRAQLVTAAGSGGALAPAAPQRALGFADLGTGLPVRFVQPMPTPASDPNTSSATKGSALSSQRFQQLDNRSNYRQNFNSPPMPQVMQDFAFERIGDRVRIVDADGSTYDGTVMPVPTEEARKKGVSQLDAAKERKDTPDPSGQSADGQSSYRFIANGVNRKLNQSVEFRGEWLPAAPDQSQSAMPALQQTSFGTARLEAQAADKKEKTSLTNALSDNATNAYFLMQQQKALPQGRISGRAVVGGKNEFDINAVPK